MAEITVRIVSEVDRDWVAGFVRERWGSTRVVSRGVLYNVTDHPGFVAVDETGERVGLLTYHMAGDQCEITLLDSARENAGVGSALIAAARDAAQAAGCARLWLITTNDNLRAIGFYQKRGFEMVAVYRRAVDDARRIKPEIPLMGLHGIPLRDEIEFEMMLTQ